MGMFVCTQEVMDLEEYGYVRVSAVDQNEARQMLEMKKLGIKSKNIYMDKQSGKDFICFMSNQSTDSDEIIVKFRISGEY